ncbi:hypothetical protein [Lentimicrobium sp. S6]|uniref:hypothetical protein n=1 Tax=Lentimicrobium sp. S6 TaxID=2735872 RepID=UPI0015536965|nr:hypothetical protein [Lentimicrobium sp. S6]NPD47604.1 hypothetical protein [Lentimicrobium sp. S6]
MAARNYSEEFKEGVLKYLRNNGHSYYKTAKKFKISKNTIKAWDDYPNNLPEEVQLRIKVNQLQRTKSLPKQAPVKYPKHIISENLPDTIKELEHHAIKAALTKGVFLLDYVSSAKEYLEVTKALSTLIQLPEGIKTVPKKSAMELFLEKYSSLPKS